MAPRNTSRPKFYLEDLRVIMENYLEESGWVLDGEKIQDLEFNGRVLKDGSFKVRSVTVVIGKGRKKVVRAEEDVAEVGGSGDGGAGGDPGVDAGGSPPLPSPGPTVVEASPGGEGIQAGADLPASGPSQASGGP